MGGFFSTPTTGVLIDWYDNFSRLSDVKSVFLFANENIRALSFETVLLNTHEKCNCIVIFIER